MSGEYRDKPGVAGRATAAFMLLNLPLATTAVVVFYLGGGATAEWWLRGILAVGVAASELAIVLETIGPPLKGWINQREWVEKPAPRT